MPEANEVPEHSPDHEAREQRRKPRIERASLRQPTAKPARRLSAIANAARARKPAQGRAQPRCAPLCRASHRGHALPRIESRPDPWKAWQTLRSPHKQPRPSRRRYPQATAENGTAQSAITAAPSTSPAAHAPDPNGKACAGSRSRRRRAACPRSRSRSEPPASGCRARRTQPPSSPASSPD